MDNLRQENEALKQENHELRERLLSAEEKIKQLIGQLNQNSRNSNWPSSRDKSRAKPKSQRKKSGRKAGGQKGHKGHTLEMNPEPDVIKIHRPEECKHCQTKLTEAAKVSQERKRQVLDFPPLKYITTEHQVQKVVCENCGQETEGNFPESVTQPVQYGQGVKQLAVYLKIEQLIPYQRTQQVLKDLFVLPVCVGTLQNMVRVAAENVKPATNAIKEAVKKSSVIHVDETGFYIGGERHWLHTASTQELSYYATHRRRGYEATEAIGILRGFQGTMVHDSWATYFKYTTAKHALCHAHHLRDLTSIIENDQQEWAQWMVKFLLSAKELIADARLGGQSELPPDILLRVTQLYDVIICFGFTENPLPETPPPQPKKGRQKKSKARNLVERFEKRKTEMLRFIFDFNVPFDNNLAERDIRMMKVQQKISGCFRSSAGAEQFCSLRSYTATIRKQGLSVWEALGSLFSGDILIPKTTPV